MKNVLITNDAIILGILLSFLVFIFMTSKSENRFFQRLYKVVPSMLLCYIFPASLNSFSIISGTTLDYTKCQPNIYYPPHSFCLHLLPTYLLLRVWVKRRLLPFFQELLELLLVHPSLLFWLPG